MSSCTVGLSPHRGQALLWGSLSSRKLMSSPSKRRYRPSIGRPMLGRYLLFEGEDMSFRELKLPHSKACPLCGDNPTVHELIDYEAWCGTTAMEPSEARAS